MNAEQMETRLVAALTDDISAGPLSDMGYKSAEYDAEAGQIELFKFSYPDENWPEGSFDVRQLARMLTDGGRTPFDQIEVPARLRVQNRAAGTSWDAAIAISPETARMYFIRIYHALLGSGPMTHEQLRAHFDVAGWAHSESGIRARCSELVTAGWVRNTGRRGETVLGNSAIIWEAVL